MKAREIMTSDPQVVTPDDTISRAAQIMRESDVGIVPVVDDANSRRLRGVITDRDIAIRHVADHHTDDCRVRDHMSDRLLKASPDDDVRRVLDTMQREQVRRMPVVEDDDRLVGIIAQADIAVDVGPDQPREVQKTVEEISRPAEPQR
jgi:CBS domain-containing protein